MKDIFERIKESAGGPLGQYQKKADGYFYFPKLEGELGPEMVFNGKKVLNWSLNNYLGLANHPEVREADAEGARRWGLASPMGARMMSGNTALHEEVESMLCRYTHKKYGYLLNFGYQGQISIIDTIVGLRDVIVYDSEAHACLIDGFRVTGAKRFRYEHNNVESLRMRLKQATELAEKQGGGILVATEGVYGMEGDLGALDKLCALKKEFDFRILIDDAHGMGVMGPEGRGTHTHFKCENDIDLYFCAFAKSMAIIGGFIGCNDEDVVRYLRMNMRSQIYAKSLPMPIVWGVKRRLEIIEQHPEFREHLWDVALYLQHSLQQEGLNTGVTASPITPVFFPGDVNQGTNVVVELREKYGIFCSIVVYPVVPKGQIMLRLIPTAVHTKEMADRTIEVFKNIKKGLDAGVFDKPMPDMHLM